MSWESLNTYKGPNWEDYLSSQPLSLEQGSYLGQFAKILLYARSLGSLTTGYRFVLPLQVDEPYNVNNPSAFFPLPQFEGSGALLPGGEYKLGTQFTMHWASGTQIARQKFTVRPFNINSLTSKSQFFEWYAAGMEKIPGGGYIFNLIQDKLAEYVYSRLGYWEPSPATLLARSAAGSADSTAGGLLSYIYPDEPPKKVAGRKNIAPWILAAIAASQIIG